MRFTFSGSSGGHTCAVVTFDPAPAPPWPPPALARVRAWKAVRACPRDPTTGNIHPDRKWGINTATHLSVPAGGAAAAGLLSNLQNNSRKVSCVLFPAC